MRVRVISARVSGTIVILRMVGRVAKTGVRGGIRGGIRTVKGEESGGEML